MRVQPVFVLLRAQLDRAYTPEQTAAITGVSATTTRELARRIGKAKAVSNVTSSNFTKYYHGNLMERAQILVFALCGHMGKKGSGFSAFPFLTQDGIEAFALMKQPGWMGKLRLAAQVLPMMHQLKKPGMTDEMLALRDRQLAAPRRRPWSRG